MTPKSPPMDLPKIPSLPPIQMPDTNLFSQKSQKTADSASSRPSSSSPYTSQDAFLTAHTSLSPDQPSSSSGNGSPVYLYPPVPPAMNTPTGLRKSISVDSFVNYKHPGMAAARPNPPSPLSADFRPSQADTDRPPPPSSRQSDAPTSTFRPPWADRDKRATAYSSSRSRGTSISTTTDDRDPSFLDESDHERAEDLARRTRKSKQSRHSVRPGELPMPSRLHPKGSAPSMQTPRPTPPISPTRSSSLNLRGVKQKPVVVNPHLPEVSDVSAISSIRLSPLRASRRPRLPSW